MSFRKRQWSYFLIFIILLLGLFMRTYQLESRLIFVYDQGRDAFKIAEILRGKLTLIGATTGLPGIFLGPFFYYFIAPWYYLGKGNPLYPALFLQFFNLLAGGYISYLLLQKIDKKIPAWLVFVSLAGSFYHWNYSKWLSNPAPILTFAPLYFYLLYSFLKSGWFAFFAGLTLAICLQCSSSNAIYFIPTTVLLWLVEKIKHQNKHVTFKNILLFVIAFTIGMSPLILFNFRHQNIIINSFLLSLSQNKNVSLWEVWEARPLYILKDTAEMIFGARGLYPLLILPLFWLVKKPKKNTLALRVILYWLVVPVVLVLGYTGNEGNYFSYYIIAQYLAYLLLLILLFSYLWQKQKIVFGLVFGLYLFLNLRSIYYSFLPKTNQISLASYKKTVDKVYELAGHNSFNVEIYVPNLLPAAYEYLFDWYGRTKYGYIPSDRPEKQLFFILEPGNDYWRQDWLDMRQNDGVLVKNHQVGIIDIQERQRE